MNADRFYMARIAHVHSYAAGAWRKRVTVYDLGRPGREPRPFLKLDLNEQAFVVARIAWREHVAPKEPTASPKRAGSKSARARAAGRRGGKSR